MGNGDPVRNHTDPPALQRAGGSFHSLPFSSYRPSRHIPYGWEVIYIKREKIETVYHFDDPNPREKVEALLHRMLLDRLLADRRRREESGPS